MWGQRRKLLNGIHPKTNLLLPMPRNMDGTLWQGVGDANSHLQGEASDGEQVREDGFYRYVPANFVKVNAGGSVPAQSPFIAILERVRLKASNRDCEVANTARVSSYW